jgi:hypothetical protein
MGKRVVAVALVVFVVLAGCSAIEINRPAAENATDAPGGPGAPTDVGPGATATPGADAGDAETGVTTTPATGDGADGGATTAGGATAATPDPTPTPVPEVLAVTNDGERDYVVSVTVTRGPIEAVELDRSDGSTDIVRLDGRSIDEVLTVDTVDVRPIEVVETTESYELDPDESIETALPGDERRHVLVEVNVEDDEEPLAVGGAVVTCPAGETVGEVTVDVDEVGADVTGRCVD